MPQILALLTALHLLVGCAAQARDEGGVVPPGPVALQATGPVCPAGAPR